MIKLGKKTTATLLIATFMISIFAVAMPVSAGYGKPTIDGMISEVEWGAPTFTTEKFNIYVVNDLEYLYVGFETLGGIYLPTGGGDVGMMNLYVMNPDTGECWAYCWIHRTIDFIEISYTYPPNPTVKLPTDADFVVTETVFELQIPLSELESISLGDTINFHFLSYAQGWNNWDNCWLHNQEYTLELPPDIDPPTITDVSVVPVLVNRGDLLTITAKVTDNVGVVAVSADFSYNPEYTDRPIPRSITMHNAGGDTYEVTYTVPEDWLLGYMIVKVAARDAENWIRSEESVTVTVIPTIDEAVEFIEAYVEHHGIANSLISKLENVQDRNFEKILNAFMNEVNAQTDKKINPIVAQTLIEWAKAWSGNPELAK